MSADINTGRKVSRYHSSRSITHLIIIVILIVIIISILIYCSSSSGYQSPDKSHIEPTKYWVICCAFFVEYNELIKCFDDGSYTQYIKNGIKYAVGEIQSFPCILCNTGISVINASRATQWIIDKFSGRLSHESNNGFQCKPSQILGFSFMGIGGSTNDNLIDGDVSCPYSWVDYGEQLYFGNVSNKDNQISRDFVRPQRDTDRMDVNQDRLEGILNSLDIAYNPPFKCGCDNQEDRYILKTYRLSQSGEEQYITGYQTTPSLLKIADSIELPYLKVGGIGGSASIFQADPIYIDYLKEVISPNLVVVDEETIAMAHVCSFYQIPWICFRLISDVESRGRSGNSNATNSISNPVDIDRLQEVCIEWIIHIKSDFSDKTYSG